MLWCLCIGAFAVSTSYPLSLVLLFVAGFLNLTYSSMSQTLVQLYAPPAIRGRVLGLYSTCANGMKAFSGVTVGMAGSLVGVHWSLALSAAALTAPLIALDRAGGPRPGGVTAVRQGAAAARARGALTALSAAQSFPGREIGQTAAHQKSPKSAAPKAAPAGR